jgi:tRNA G18 (ribose-2'-O)-methylase SpoU
VPRFVPVADPADPRLEPYRDIRERDLKGRAGRFIAEGRVVLDVLLRGGRFEPESLLLLESRVAGTADVLARAAADLPVFVAPPAVFDAVAGFPVHRGILGVARRRAGDTVEGLVGALPARALAVACIGIANHDNIGAIFRNAAAFGADAVLLDATCCDPLYRKAVRVSVGAALAVPFAVAPDVGSIVAALSGAGFQQLALSPGGLTPLHAVTRAPRTALFVGAEGPGLPAPLLAGLETVGIPMRSGWDSLNVATAAALALYHLSGGADARP